MHPSSSLAGPLGLNLVPSARMDPTGTVRLGVAALDPYLHTTLGVQVADPLYVGLRQTAETPGILREAERLYPGIDLKLRLLREESWKPEIALGLQSAIGHKRMAGEYLAVTRGYKSFDFTTGIGWGRYGSAGHFDNPLGRVSHHFNRDRALDGDNPSGPSDWFTGKKTGLFAGVEYQTNIPALSLKADWGADRYTAESALLDGQKPAPWSVGLSFTPMEWLNMQLAIVGGDKLMGRIDLKTAVQKWIGRSSPDTKKQPLSPVRPPNAVPADATLAAAAEGLYLNRVEYTPPRVRATLDLSGARTTPDELGRVIRHTANHTPPAIDEILITPTYLGLQGREIKVVRRDFEQALLHRQGSPAEIWRNTEFITPEKTPGTVTPDRSDDGSFGGNSDWRFKLALKNQVSLAEEDSGYLYRTGLSAGGIRHYRKNFLWGGSFRLNLADNLDRLKLYRLPSPLPVRSNVDRFADQRVGLDTFFLSWAKSWGNDWHSIASVGYLEEMYGGLGGEVIWRPFGRTFALGVEAYQVFKRDPEAFLYQDFTGDALLTGHLNAWYEFPDSDLTLKLSAGRYLAGDPGVGATLTRSFDNGARLEAFVTYTDQTDPDLFGGSTNMYNGLRFVLPLGQIKHLPPGSEIDTTLAPFGRDTGQRLEPPLTLYDMTEPLSYRHLSRRWNDVLD